MPFFPGFIGPGLFSVAGSGAGVGDAIDYGCRFNDDDAPHLYREVPATPGNRKTITWSIWFRLGDIGLSNGAFLFSADDTEFSVQIQSNNTLRFHSNSANYIVDSDMVFRDTTSFYHLVIRLDTTQSTEEDRLRMYVNGNEISFTEAFGGIPPQDHEVGWNKESQTQFVGKHRSLSYEFDGVIAEVIVLDGIAEVPTAFGEFDAFGNWRHKNYTGSYGTEGFHLDFADSANLGNDVSGNNNDFTSSGLTTDDQLVDTPTSVYARTSEVFWNPGSITWSEANLKIYSAAGRGVTAPFAMKSGKWYFESKLIDASPTGAAIGVTDAPAKFTTQTLGKNASWLCNSLAGDKFDHSTSGTSYGSASTQNDVMMCAVDLDVGKIWFGKNGTWFNSGNPATGVNAAFTNLPTGGTAVFPVFLIENTETQLHNFGESGFSHAAPSGFNACHTGNLAAPAIKDPRTGFVTAVDTGANIEATLDAEMQPSSWSNWIKIYRDTTGGSWKVRFSDDTANMWYLDDTSAKITWSAPSGSNENLGIAIRVGSTYGCLTGTVEHTNGGGDTTVTHNLGDTDHIVICTNEDSATTNRFLYTPELDSGKLLYIEANSAQTTDSAIKNFGANSFDIDTGESSGTYRYIVLKRIPGFFEFGLYNGDAADDGEVVPMGLSPDAMFAKRTDAAVNWYCLPDKLSDHGNQHDAAVYLDVSTAKVTGSSNEFDILSNGFKARTTVNFNSNNDHIWFAWGRPTGGPTVSPHPAR